MTIFQSASFWFVVAIAVILVGGLVTGFLYREPEMKPTLAAQKDETEAEIKDELEKDETLKQEEMNE